MSKRAPRIGLVLGGGGIAGMSYHAGALSALSERTGWDPRTAEVIVGSSAGSMIGATLRAHVSVSGLLETLLSVPINPENMARLRDVSGRNGPAIPRFWAGPASIGLAAREMMRFPASRPSRLIVSMLPAGRLSTDAITEDLRELEVTEWPGEALWLTALRLDTGERVVFGRDLIPPRLDRAVEASCAIPGFFKPVSIDGVRYVDGGIPSITNADLVAELSLDLVVILAPLSLHRISLRNPLVALARSLMTQQVAEEAAILRAKGADVLVLAPTRDVVHAMGINPMDPTRVVPVVLQASASTYQLLTAPERANALELLERAGRLYPSPEDAVLR